MLMNSAGERFTDTGTRLYRLLEDAGVEWRPLTRLNRRDLHPLWFGVYGDAAIGPVVYHHGAGFRERRARIDSVKMGTGGRLAVRLMSWRRAGGIPRGSGDDGFSLDSLPSSRADETSSSSRHW
jgi:hypothetical protein